MDATGHKDTNKDHFCDTCGKENITDHDYVNGLCSHCGAMDPTICINCDLDLDGDIDANDLTMHARYIAGIITDWEQE